MLTKRCRTSGTHPQRPARTERQCNAKVRSKRYFANLVFAEISTIQCYYADWKYLI